MDEEQKRLLKVFLCHAASDKPAVRELYTYLRKEGVNAWLDEEELLPGQDWDAEIMRALQESDAIIICLSEISVSREGYVQREIKEALDKAREKPSGTIFVIPAKLDDCKVPSYLKNWQWVELFSENGPERLMRSLRSRAEGVGAVIAPMSVEEFVDEELENELKRLFIEGRGAFLVENWDKAIHRFKKILSLRPNYPDASEQLVESERQRSFTKRYMQGLEAYREKNWQVATSVLGELLRESPNYKDASKLFEDAKRQKELIDLYTEAQELHAARQWHAVIKVFAQITAIEPNYQDPDGLLSSAEKEAAELKRLARLNELYSQSVHAIDTGQWYEARGLLEQIHKAQIGFLETESLLRKVEDEIIKLEGEKKRQDQIHTLYEQARGLFRSKLWQQALDKITEIRDLEPQFEDTENIAVKVQYELEREKQQTELQNRLAAIYSEAIRLVKEQKYQHALEKWQEIITLDPKYPDRQKVEATARQRLDQLAKRPQTWLRYVDAFLLSLRKLIQEIIIPRWTVVLITLLAIISVVIVWNRFSIPQDSDTPIIPGLPAVTETSTSSDSPTRIIDGKDIPMILVPAGTFEMGSDQGDSDEAPVHTVYLNAYYIDQYEVTNRQYSDCVQARRCDSPKETSSKLHASYYGAPIFDKYPVVHVDWDMAKAYCEWRRARLPTEAEWEKAARGDKDQRTYPWGEDIECYNANYIRCIFTDTQEVTKYSSGKSSYGIYNMSGNVWEWVADWYLASFYQDSPMNNPLGPSSGLSHVTRGGAFDEQPSELRVTNRNFQAASIARNDIGFRCARPVSTDFP